MSCKGPQVEFALRLLLYGLQLCRNWFAQVVVVSEETPEYRLFRLSPTYYQGFEGWVNNGVKSKRFIDALIAFNASLKFYVLFKTLVSIVINVKRMFEYHFIASGPGSDQRGLE
ncbi:hypothetical protein Tco_1530225 [Tanacetum coccineum]